MKPYYEHSGVTIYHGDCRDILPTLTEPVDLVLTDPPYGVTYESNRVPAKDLKPITNDGTRLSLALYREVLPMLNARHLLWFTRWDAWPDVWGIIGHHYPLRGLLVWNKRSPGMGDLAHWGPSYELIASAGYGKITGGRDGSVLDFTGVPSTGRLHPTQKPVSLLRYLIEKMTVRSVLDPFMGSGSTLEAALQLGVPAIGVEGDERYCEIAAKRLQQEVLLCA